MRPQEAAAAALPLMSRRSTRARRKLLEGVTIERGRGMRGECDEGEKKKKAEARKKVGDFERPPRLSHLFVVSFRLSRALLTLQKRRAVFDRRARGGRSRRRGRAGPRRGSGRRRHWRPNEWNFLASFSLFRETSLQLLSTRRGKREPSEDSCGKKEKEKRRDHLRRESNTPSPTKQ